MTPITLKRYSVDRCKVASSSGIVEGVVFVLTSIEGRDYAFCLSKVDARLISQQLNLAALDAQKDGRS